LEENIEEYNVVWKMDHRQLSKHKRTSTSDLENLVEKEEGQASEVLKMRVKLT
jgi:hypothetical protein